MKTRIFNLIILDESGSMQSIKREAVNSVNETVQTIRAAQRKYEDQEHYVSLVTFNDAEIKSTYNCVPAMDVVELTDEQYSPNCCTPLYDAMGQSLNSLRQKVASDDRVLVTIVTDGLENSSKEYTGKAIKALVDELKAKGWVFAYIGANHDVEQAAATISIHNTMSFKATMVGTAQMSKRSNSSRSSFFDRIAHNIFDSESENQCFFDDNK